MAGDELDEDIINYVKREYNLAIGQTTAEQIKKEIGCAMAPMTIEQMYVKGALEKTPPELASDIAQKGIILAGGGALIKNLDKLLMEKTDMPVYIAENPLNSVVKGTEKTLEEIEKLKHVLTSSSKRV